VALSYQFWRLASPDSVPTCAMNVSPGSAST
jgi:hypothetical protein